MEFRGWTLSRHCGIRWILVHRLVCETWCIVYNEFRRIGITGLVCCGCGYIFLGVVGCVMRRVLLCGSVNRAGVCVSLCLFVYSMLCRRVLRSIRKECSDGP